MFDAVTIARPFERAASTTARASGCSLPDSSAAAIRSASLESIAASAISTSVGLPSVSVPVLSNATMRARCAISSAPASFTRMPWRAATPVPAMIAAGVASPSAQGHAITSTATAFSVACAQSPLAKPHAIHVTSAIATITGTKTSLTRSTSRCTGAFAAWADSTLRMMRASADSAPTASVFTTSRPSAFREPPVTRAPADLATGRLSPVMSDSSTCDVPSITSPSTAMRSPGRTTTRSPTAMDSIATSASTPSRSTRARSGRSAERARMASVARRFARASSHLPRRTSVITTADASK